MRKQQLKIITNLATIFLLCMTLLLSVSYGWYTNNKEVNANGLYATSASDNLTVSNQGAYSTQIGSPDDPYPDKKSEVTGVLAGDIVYFSISIKSAKNKKLKSSDLTIAVTSIFGDEYFIEPAKEITKTQYDVYSKIDSHLTYEKKERVLHPLYKLSNGKYYYLSLVNTVHYINYVTVDEGNMELGEEKELTETEYQNYVDNPGSTTDYIYTCDEKITYITHIDNTGDSTTNDHYGREYFLTAVDGVYYINYIYETTNTDGSKKRYNMCDVYSYEVYKVYGRDDLTKKEYTSIYDPSSVDGYKYIGNPFTKVNGLDKSIAMFNIFDPTNYDATKDTWINVEYTELTFTFKFVFDYSNFEDSNTGDYVININSVSYREIQFNNLVISEATKETTNEGATN